MANLIDLVVKGQAGKAIKGLKDTKNEAKATRTEITLMFGVLDKITKKMIKLTDYSDQYNTSLRLLKTTLGETTSQATKFINKLSEMSGIDETTIMRQTAKFVQLGESLNMSNEVAEKFSENLSILTTKLSLLYNMDYAKMGTNVQKALQGKPSTLTTATGISVKDTTEQATLLAYGIDRQVSSLNDAELALVKYATILRQVTSDNQAYQDSVNSLAWQKQMLTAQAKRLSTVLGQLLTPVLTRVLTIFNAILMVITELITMLGSLIGVNVGLNGSVDNVSDSYDSLGKAISGASNTAKKSLRSFDMLNNITTPSGGAKGGALGIDSSLLKLLDNVDENFLKIRNKATEIRDRIMEWLGFTKDVNGEWQWSSDKLLKNVGNGIKNIWNWYKKLNVVVKAFIGFALYKVLSNIVSAAINLYTAISSKVIGAFKTLTSLAELGNRNFVGMADAFVKTATNAERMAMGIGGVTASISGLFMIVSAVQSIKEEGANLNNVLTLIIGTLALVTGAIVAATAVAGTFTVTMAAATGGISLLIGAVAGLIGWFAVQDTQVKQSESTLASYEKQIKEVKEAEQDNILALESKVGRVKTLKKELEVLVDSNGKVVGSEEEVSRILSALNELLDTEYKITNGQITLNGEKVKTYDALKNSIDKYCASLRTEGYLEIKRQEYNKRLEVQLNLQKEINSITSLLTSSQKNYDMTSEEGVKKWVIANSDRLKRLSELQSQYKTNEQQLDAYEQAGYLASVGRYDEAQKLLTKTFSDVGVTMGDVINELIKDTEKMPNIVKQSINQITSQKPVVTVNVNADTSNAKRQINSLFAGAKITLGTDITPRAEGGFVNQGELFVAREAGPELVGQINGHTAVANNDQIVEGIQAGVFSGMMSALRNTDFGGSSNVVIEANGDTEGLLNFIQFKQRQKDRQFN